MDGAGKIILSEIAQTQRQMYFSLLYRYKLFAFDMCAAIQISTEVRYLVRD